MRCVVFVPWSRNQHLESSCSWTYIHMNHWICIPWSSHIFYRTIFHEAMCGLGLSDPPPSAELGTHTEPIGSHTPNRSAGQSVRPLWANMAMDFRRSWISGEAKNISSDKNTIESFIYIYGMQNSHMELLGTRTITLDDALFFVRGCRKKPLATTAGPLAEQKLVHTMPFWWVLSHPQIALNIWVSFAMVYNRRYHRIHCFWQEKRIMNQWIQTLLPIFWCFPIIFWLISRFFP
jgi:hypothetical protein